MVGPVALVVLALVLVAVVLGSFAQLQARYRLVSAMRAVVPVGVLVLALAAGASHHARGRVLIVAVVLSLLGEAALLLPRVGGFALGLGATLASRVGYAITFLVGGFALLWGGVGILVVLLFGLTAGRRIILGGRREGGQALTNALSTYLVAVGLMLATGFATAYPVVAVGAGLLAFSDMLLGLNRFVGARPNAALVVPLAAQLGQVLIVVGLLR